jgi:hypothetical protein
MLHRVAPVAACDHSQLAATCFSKLSLRCCSSRQLVMHAPAMLVCARAECYI